MIWPASHTEALPPSFDCLTEPVCPAELNSLNATYKSAASLWRRRRRRRHRAADTINRDSVQLLKWLHGNFPKSGFFKFHSQHSGQQLHKESVPVAMCGQRENTNLSCRCRQGPARCWCPWRSPGWRFPWWPLSLWAYSSVCPGLLASWHVWSPCSGPRPGSVRRTNSRLSTSPGKQHHTEPGGNAIWKLERRSRWSTMSTISICQLQRLAVQK